MPARGARDVVACLRNHGLFDQVNVKLKAQSESYSAN